MIIEKSIKAKLRKGTKPKCYKVAPMTLDMKPEYIRTKMLVEFKQQKLHPYEYSKDVPSRATTTIKTGGRN